MNATASSHKAAMLAEDLRRRQRRHRRSTPLWTLASILFHSAAFLSLLLFTPMRELVIPQPKEAPPPNLNAERIEELAQTLEDIHRSDLMAYVEELELTRAEMDAVREEMLESYNEFAERQTETAADTIEAFINEAATLQRDAMERQQAAAPVLHETGKAQQEAIDKQVLAKDTIEKAQQRAALTGMAKSATAMSEAAQAQETANAEQVEALRTSAALRQSIETVKRSDDEAAKAAEAKEAASAQLSSAEAKAAEAKEAREAAADRAAEAAKAAETAKTEVQAAETAQRQAKEKADAARKEKDAAARDVAAKAANEAQKQFESARAEARKASDAQKQEDTKARQAAATDQSAEKALQTARDRLQQRVAEAEKKKAQAEAAKTAEAEARKVAATTQEEAAAEQKRAADALLAAARTVVSETPDPQPVASAATVAALPPEVRRMDVVDLYALARELEGKVTETYRDVRAAEVAMLRSVPIEQARALTDVAKPVRPELDTAALREATRTADAFERRKEQTATAIREAQGMVEASRSLLDVARSLAQDGTAFSAEGIAAMTSRQAAVSAAAAENEDVRAKDLAALMRGQGAADSAPSMPLPAGPESGAQKKDVVAEDTSHLDRSKNHPILTDKTPNVHPGTIVGENNVATSWMSVDSWYILGPFPNPQRANIDRKFPPETVLDLDASYVGKDGRVIRWTHHKSPRTVVVPDNNEPYGIWYAYTELTFPEACDTWIAVGSDDKSKIWINDTLVWESVPWHKSWNISEGYRRVHFRQGRNRVLYRIENGQHTIGWSMAVHLAESLGEG